MNLLDMMREQMFEEQMAAAEAHGALVRMAKDATQSGDYETAFLAWLVTGSHEWDVAPVEWSAADYAALDY